MAPAHPTLLKIFILVLAAIGVGIVVGMRIQLARQRFRALWRTLDRFRNVNSTESLFVDTLKRRSECERAGYQHHVRVLNVVQFVVIWNWDLTTLLDQMAAIPEAWSIEAGWRKKLLARTLALSAHEAISKLRATFDPSFNRTWSLRRAVRALGLGTELDALLDDMFLKLSRALSAHAELIQGVRDNAIGHRDQDATAQIEWMRRMDASEVETLGWELLALNTELLKVLTSVTSVMRARSPYPVIPPGAT